VVRFLLTAFRAEGITPWVRDALLARLAEALAAHAASGPVGPKDAAVLIRAMALGEIPDLDAIVDKDWLWSLWKAMEQWLAELREKAQARRGKRGRGRPPSGGRLVGSLPGHRPPPRGMEL